MTQTQSNAYTQSLNKHKDKCSYINYHLIVSLSCASVLHSCLYFHSIYCWFSLFYSIFFVPNRLSHYKHKLILLSEMKNILSIPYISQKQNELPLWCPFKKRKSVCSFLRWVQFSRVPIAHTQVLSSRSLSLSLSFWSSHSLAPTQLFLSLALKPGHGL